MACFHNKVVNALLVIGGFASVASATTDSTTVVWAVAGQQANLPCRPAAKLPGDQPVLVLWYRTSQTLPIYSYDARNGDFSSGVRWTDNRTFGGRAYFDAKVTPPALTLNPAHALDEGQYMCRIDYRTSSSTNSLVNLNIIISPGPATIFWKGRETEQGTVGPLQEDERASLTCRSVGGKPSPTVIWNFGKDAIAPTDTKFNFDPVTGTYTVESTITVTAERGMVGHRLTCSAHTSIGGQSRDASNKPVVRSRSASVSLDITLPPLNVQILGSESLVVTAGSEIKMSCRAYGSHPPAKITWWKDDVLLEPFVTYRVGPDGNATAMLRMNVSAEDDRGRLTCQARNPYLSQEPLYDVTQLIVYYPPKVTLSLGPHLQADDIKEGDDVYFECDIRANPSFNRVEWFHNVS
ncbi:nephrin-like [Macrobrachium rosenbergii]|uniref:nephrin-like n=1 Tax=Macrobrachium rosenbergii TaxID=79674 RepID=UPI0034D45B84